MQSRKMYRYLAFALAAACGDGDGDTNDDVGLGGSSLDAGGGTSELNRLDPSSLDKFVDPVLRPPRIPGFEADGTPRDLVMGMFEIKQRLHRQLPATTVWGYGPTEAQASYPGPTIDARPGIETRVQWENHLPANHILPVDETIHWADPDMWPGAGVPTVVHVHGGLQQSSSDGHPDAWFTPDFAQTGPAFSQKVYRYPNDNLEELLWYHDHALGLTRLNVYAGLAGFYLLRDPDAEAALGLPTGEQDLELVFQDRAFNTDGSLFYPDVGVNPDVHPQWVPEFFGDVNLVNGVVWPYLEVEPKRYRFRMLNGANARFYRFELTNERPFIQIGTDGGYLEAPVEVTSLLLAPGERADVIIDFGGLDVGSRVEIRNSAPAPFPSGDDPDGNTSQVMQFRIVEPSSADESVIPDRLDTIETLGPPEATRTHTLIEVEDPSSGEPLGVFLDGKRWGAPGTVSEVPEIGSTEVWQLVNLTMDAHPIHLHLIDFQILDRQPFDTDAYRADYTAMNPNIPIEDETEMTLDVDPYLRGDAQPPAANEVGWKDTVVAPPGTVTRFIVRWAPEGGGAFPFDATTEPGYVWHCHILEHEDNEMMRRYRLVNPLTE